VSTCLCSHTCPVTGNHESIYDSLNYRKRFTMPNFTLTHSLWYSLDHGNTHWLGHTSEAYFEMEDRRDPEIERSHWGPRPKWVSAQQQFIESDQTSDVRVVRVHNGWWCSDTGRCPTAAATLQGLTAGSIGLSMRSSVMSSSRSSTSMPSTSYLERTGTCSALEPPSPCSPPTPLRLRVLAANTTLVRRRLRWLWHVRRMPWHRVPRELLTF
jgi:hypothetical protein